MTTPKVIKDGAEMVRQMRPEQQPGAWVFRSVPETDLPDLLSNAQAVFREAEGVSVLVPGTASDEDAMAQITLQVFSALDGVGLTAAVSSALAEQGIPANVIAATHHDHVFVPFSMAERALQVLQDLSNQSQSDE